MSVVLTFAMRRALIVLALVCGAGVADAEPPTTHEVIYTKPSGFWTSNRPAAPGQEYRWRLLGIGVVLVGIAGYVTLRLVRKAAADRASRLGQIGAAAVDRDIKAAK